MSIVTLLNINATECIFSQETSTEFMTINGKLWGFRFICSRTTTITICGKSSSVEVRSTRLPPYKSHITLYNNCFSSLYNGLLVVFNNNPPIYKVNVYI